MDYVTFSSPESIIYILEYLIQSPPKDLESPLFRIARNSNTGLTYGTLNMKFARINDELGYGRVGRNRFFHSHTLRKLFATTLYKQKLQQLTVDWFLGHKIDPITEAYFKSDIDTLKDQYLTCIKDLSIEAVEIRHLETEDIKKLEALKSSEVENQRRISQLEQELQEQKQTKEKVDKLEAIVQNFLSKELEKDLKKE
jgi:DNA-directed RNA polymerase beta' subunit